MIGMIACASEGLDPEGLVDPASCEGCHPDQVREWAGSMHAYASDDPVFLAMNRLGQRETGGALGDFCVRCHAPLAAGRDLASLPRAERGVTCVACHQAVEVQALHNGALRWSRDRTMRGGLRDAVETPAHASSYSVLLDTAELESSAMCGACHDVVSPRGVEVERTYAEWTGSVFGRLEGGLSCAGCHMPGRAGAAAYGEVERRVHDHGLAAVDVALGEWPGLLEQRTAIERDLGSALSAKLCAQPGGGGVRVDVTLDNVQAGHSFPSGVTHARRVWLELIATQGEATTYQVGAYQAGDVVPLNDPQSWVLGSRFLGDDGGEVAHVWDAASVDSRLLPPSVTLDPRDPAYYHAVTRSFTVPGTPDMVQIRVRMQPVGLEIVDRLIEEGELEPAIRDRLPIFDLASTVKEWRRARDGWGCAP